MTKQTILRKAAKLILNPDWEYDWFQSGKCTLGAILEVITGESKRFVGVGCYNFAINYYFNGDSLPDEFRPLLKAGFSLQELSHAELTSNERIAKKAGINSGYCSGEDAAKYLVAWADILSHR